MRKQQRQKPTQEGSKEHNPFKGKNVISDRLPDNAEEVFYKSLINPYSPEGALLFSSSMHRRGLVGLLAKKCPEFKTKEGMPYLFLALSRVDGGLWDEAWLDVVEFLLENGADPDDRGSLITSPREFARNVARNFSQKHGERLKKLFNL